MTQAYIIECGEDAAGIVTQESRGFIFHAAARLYRRLDGQAFNSVRKAQAAAEALRRSRREAETHSNRQGRG